MSGGNRNCHTRLAPCFLSRSLSGAPRPRPYSVAAVRFGPVQHQYFPNLELNPGSGSAKPPNLEPDLGSRFDGVRFRFRRGLDGFEPNFLPTVQTGGKPS
ncbi:hypothetical protein B0H16DRAFT_1686731 [Mycena metata]|uniref:Uncharacterized protein n=1 Tax=Mycena metata TaxID=1033252 RepID=A0AAD7NMX4_9AGAR|nr:hypothetical protein B0H16DRAFT_1686731 [Mycena metata]